MLIQVTTKPDIAQFVGRLDLLIAEYERLKATAQYEDLSDLRDEGRLLAARLQAAIDRIAPVGDTYHRAADALRGQRTRIRIIELSKPLAYALREDLKAGWATSVVELLHAASNAELLDMSTDRRAAGYKDAAAVIAGTALEMHLRALAPKQGISVLDSKQKTRKANALKTELRQAAVVSPLVEKQITV